MAERRAIIPGQRAPLVNKDGLIDPIWHKFLVDLYERTGGGAEDKVDVGANAAETAQQAADDAQAAADTAQALSDQLESRLDFDFEFDLR